MVEIIAIVLLGMWAPLATVSAIAWRRQALGWMNVAQTWKETAQKYRNGLARLAGAPEKDWDDV